jgi:hypothetical protein
MSTSELVSRVRMIISVNGSPKPKNISKYFLKGRLRQTDHASFVGQIVYINVTAASVSPSFAHTAAGKSMSGFLSIE